MTRSLRHPVVARLDDDRSRSERIADGAVAAMGSMRFIVIQTAIVAAWIAVNVLAVTLRWDAYPFIALNLLFSTQAAYAAPLILLAARRADAKRDALAGHHYDESRPSRRSWPQTLPLPRPSTTIFSSLDRDCQMRSPNVKQSRPVTSRPQRRRQLSRSRSRRHHQVRLALPSIHRIR